MDGSKAPTSLWTWPSSKEGLDGRKKGYWQQEGKFVFRKKSALHTLERSTWSSAYANQRWPILEVAREDEGRF